MEHHGCDRGDRPGHRVDAKERTVGHLPLALEILNPDRLQIADLPVPCDRGNGSGDPSLGDEFFEQRRGRTERLPVQTCLGSRNGRTLSRASPCCGIASAATRIPIVIIGVMVSSLRLKTYGLVRSCRGPGPARTAAVLKGAGR
jgi:hypothetical protein